MTADKAVVSLDKIFQPGQAYVALSRVTSLKGLFLIKEDVEYSNIYCNPKIEEAISQMPSYKIIPTVAESPTTKFPGVQEQHDCSVA